MELWQQVAVALALVLIIEGAMPFLVPDFWRKMVSEVAQLDNSTLRGVGLFSMLLGLGLLYLFN
ncbi:MAG: DUF2065 domain-containing protein [Halieaceae bacterium]